MYLWSTFHFTLALLLECCLRNCGHDVPLLSMALFYLTVIYTYGRTAYIGLLFCVLSDYMSGRCYPVSLLYVVIIFMGASYWRHYGNLRERFVQMLPGMLIGVSSAASTLLYGCLYSLRESGRLHWMSPIPMLEQLVVGIVAFPFFCILADYFGMAFGFGTYKYANQKWGEE